MHLVLRRLWHCVLGVVLVGGLAIGWLGVRGGATDARPTSALPDLLNEDVPDVQRVSVAQSGTATLAAAVGVRTDELGGRTSSLHIFEGEDPAKMRAVTPPFAALARGIAPHALVGAGRRCVIGVVPAPAGTIRSACRSSAARDGWQALEPFGVPDTGDVRLTGIDAAAAPHRLFAMTIELRGAVTGIRMHVLDEGARQWTPLGPVRQLGRGATPELSVQAGRPVVSTSSSFAPRLRIAALVDGRWVSRLSRRGAASASRLGRSPLVGGPVTQGAGLVLGISRTRGAGAWRFGLLRTPNGAFHPVPGSPAGNQQGAVQQSGDGRLWAFWREELRTGAVPGLQRFLARLDPDPATWVAALERGVRFSEGEWTFADVTMLATRAGPAVLYPEAHGGKVAYRQRPLPTA